MSFRQEDIDELFTDLKVIGSIKQHDRISTSGAQIRIDSGYLQPVRRTFAGEGRDANLRGIKRSMTAANAFIDLAMAPPSTPDKVAFLVRMRRELANTIRGLRNLQTTYDGDITTQSKIDVHIENVRNKFSAIQAFMPPDQQCSDPIDIPYGGGLVASSSMPDAVEAARTDADDVQFHTPSSVQESEIERLGQDNNSRRHGSAHSPLT